ncbi:MAG: hypothetical protein JNK48_05765, partial [Bryobacterales bacterium]|nr:hypothetical protein [Bryobacterales bacterium]
MNLRAVAILFCCLLVSCVSPPGPGASAPAGSRSEVQDFLAMYDEIDGRLATVASESQWKSSTDVNDQHTGERIGADRALAGFRGSRYVIETAKALLSSRKSLSDSEFRQLDKILLQAA